MVQCYYYYIMQKVEPLDTLKINFCTNWLHQWYGYFFISGADHDDADHSLMIKFNEHILIIISIKIICHVFRNMAN